MLRVVAFLPVLVFAVGPALAETFCAPRSDLIEYLRDAYREVPAASGTTAEGNRVEILVSRDGSWTLIVTTPEGKRCAEVAGNGWRESPRLTKELPET
ncbi:MAG: hypothetical protein O3A21_09020 [Proteobacteria bacterium]|nr:hypothetical protein [Pseudomonadota bacterium]